MSPAADLRSRVDAGRERVEALVRADPARAVGPAAVVAGVVFVGLFASNYIAFLVLTSAIFAIAALSVTILTGYAGQISLAVHAFFGIGAFMTGIFMQRLDVPWLLAVVFAMAVSVPVSVAVGLPALRLRGLQLAIATLAFAVAVERLFFRWGVGRLIGEGTGGGIALRVSVPRPEIFGIEFRDTAFYFLVMAFLGVGVLVAFSLQRGWSGRSLTAVRDDETAAASVGIGVAKHKLVAFALGGMYATCAGALHATLLGTAVADFYTVFLTVTIVAMAVIGGIRTPWGALLGALLLQIGPEITVQIPVLGDIENIEFYVPLIAALGLILLMIFQPDGIVPDLARRLRDLRAGRRAAHDRDGVQPDHAALVGAPLVAAPPSPTAGNGSNGHGTVRARAGLRRAFAHPLIETMAAHTRERPERDRSHFLDVRSLSIRFGGVQALDRVSFRAARGAITGLIGPNGAGKTTLFNCVTGLVSPDQGVIRFRNVDVVGVPPHVRARLGMSRTFQTIRLFDDLDVLDNLLVARASMADVGLGADLLRAPSSLREHRRAAKRAWEVLDFLDLGRHAHSSPRDLPFGVLKQVEVARAMVRDPDLVLLDEPAGGLDEEETETLSEVIVRMRDELGLTVVLIEHDMGLVMPVCDHIFVVDFGQIIASGTPDEVQSSPAVIEAYLGGEEETAALGS